MGVPATTPRTAPVGLKLDDGFSTLIAFEADPDVSFWEKTVKPPGVDGGDAIDTTTMHNTDYRTMAARALKTLTESSSTVAYDPRVYDQIMDLINVEGSITIHFPDNSSLSFFGYLRTFETNDLSEGEQPEATITITCTNVDPSDGSEAGPNYISPAGTD